MQKKLIVFVISTLFINCVFADAIRCPTVREIQNHLFNFWLPLYKNNEELASPNDVEQFKKNVDILVEAKWDPTYLESAHCFYEGRDPIVHEIVFAQDAWRPIFPLSKWVWIIENKLAQCPSQNPEDCYFQG